MFRMAPQFKSFYTTTLKTKTTSTSDSPKKTTECQRKQQSIGFLSNNCQFSKHPMFINITLCFLSDFTQCLRFKSPLDQGFIFHLLQLMSHLIYIYKKWLVNTYTDKCAGQEQKHSKCFQLSWSC